VLYKPSGLLSIPGRKPHLADSIWTRLQDQFPHRRIGLIHRLDRDTSGLMLFSSDEDLQGRLGRLFEQRRIHKEYRARVLGSFRAELGIINAPLRKDWSRRDAPVYQVHPEGRVARTRFECLKRGEDYSEMRLFPETGRSHQLRVHLQRLGHPIAGDPIYAAEDPSPRLCLCATRLRFRHPLTREELDFQLPIDYE